MVGDLGVQPRAKSSDVWRPAAWKALNAGRWDIEIRGGKVSVVLVPGGDKVSGCVWAEKAENGSRERLVVPNQGVRRWGRQMLQRGSVPSEGAQESERANKL